MINDYAPHSYYCCIDAYKQPENEDDWHSCPKCGLKPRTWVFDNGEHTACGCWESRYDHFDVQVDETIGQCVRRTGGFAEYDSDAHRRKWNQYCLQGMVQ